MSEKRSRSKRKRHKNAKVADEHLKKMVMAARKKRCPTFKRLESILSTELSGDQKQFFDEHANEDEKKLRGTAKMSNGQIHSYISSLGITQ